MAAKRRAGNRKEKRQHFNLGVDKYVECLFVCLFVCLVTLSLAQIAPAVDRKSEENHVNL